MDRKRSRLNSDSSCSVTCGRFEFITILCFWTFKKKIDSLIVVSLTEERIPPGLKGQVSSV